MKEGDFCRVRLNIPPWDVYYNAYESREWVRRWSGFLRTLSQHGLEMSFNVKVLKGNWFLRFNESDRFGVTESGEVLYRINVGLANYALLPERCAGSLPQGTTVMHDFFPEAQRSCIAWILCAKRLKIPKDMIQFIGHLVLSSWNDADVWASIFDQTLSP